MRFPVLHVLAALANVRHCHFSYSSGYIAISPCAFTLISLMNVNPFSYVYWPLIYLFSGVPVCLLAIFYWTAYVFLIGLLVSHWSDICISNFFSHFVTCLITLPAVSSGEQKFLILTYPIIIFYLCLQLLVSCLRYFCLPQHHDDTLSCLRSCIILLFLFRSTIYLELILRLIFVV